MFVTSFPYLSPSVQINPGDTTITVDTTNYPAEGYLYANGNVIRYT